MSKETLKLGLILGAIALFVSLILAFANGATKPVIEQRLQTDIQNALNQVLKADSYEAVTLPQGVGSDVKEIYTAKSGDDVLGYCVKVTPSGYGGAIQMIVGVAKDGKVKGISITDMSETPGLGTLAKDEKFIGQYKDKSAPIKVNKDGGDIQALSGATITSRAVTKGVNQAADAAKILSGGAK